MSLDVAQEDQCRPDFRPIEYSAALRVAMLLDDVAAGIAFLPPGRIRLAEGCLRAYLFANLGSAAANRLAEISWAAADILEELLSETEQLVMDW